MALNEEEIQRLVNLQIENEQKLQDFKAKYKTNPEIIGGIYESGKNHVSIHFLKQVGFDGSQLKGRILNQESPIFSKTEFDNFICGDYACIYEGDGFKIVKINFEDEYKQLQIIESLNIERESIKSALWAYQFDIEVKDADYAKLYQQKKLDMDLAISQALPSLSKIENSFKRTQAYFDEIKKKLELKSKQLG